MSSVIRDWVKKIRDKPVPVLPHTANKLRTLCGNESTPIQKIVDAVEQDPGLTVQLLRTCNGSDGKRLQREITSVQQAIMMVGTQSVARMAADLPTIEKDFESTSRTQILRVFCRAYHAGIQAVEWARIRRDLTPDEVFAASQLHFLGEIILAMYAPDKLLEIFNMRQEKNIASEEAQYLCLGFTFDQLSMEIARSWSLPQLVIEALQAENANHPRGFAIMLAVQLARSAAIDWYSDKMSGIYKSIAECINMEVEDVIRDAHQLAVKVAQNSNYYDVLQSAALLPQIRGSQGRQKITQTFSQDYQADICLTPQVNVLRDTILKIKDAVIGKQDNNKIIHICLEGMHDGIGLNRVVFATPDNERKALHAKAVVGAENDPVFNRFTIRLDKPHLFFRLLDKPQAVCVNDSNRDRFWPLVPIEFQKLIGTNSFIAMSVFADNKLLGLLYADRHTSACQIDEASYNYFKKLCNTLGQAVSQSN